MSKKKSSADYSEFIPPKLPFGWLATTFVAPILFVVVSTLFTEDEMTWSVRIAVALGLFAIMLFVSCIMLTLKLYSYWYTQQLIKYKSEETRKELVEMRANLEAYQYNFDKELLKIEVRLEDMSTDSKSLKRKADALFSKLEEQLISQQQTQTSGTQTAEHQEESV